MANERMPAAALNRELIDDRDGRLSIHTNEIRLTQAHLPYQPVTGKRLPSTKHFAVFADRIILDSVLQNPGRNIELNAREIVIEKPATLDVAGAYADKDFAPGELPVQKDAKPGAAGTNGADGTVGGKGGAIVINARAVSNKVAQARALTVSDLGSVSGRVYAGTPPKIDDTIGLGKLELGKLKLYGDYEIAVAIEDARIEGLSKWQVDMARYDGSSGRVAIIVYLPVLSLTGQDSNRRVSSEKFRCRILATAKLGAGGKLDAIETEPTLISEMPIAVKNRVSPGVLSDAALDTVRRKIAAHLRDAVVEPLLKGLGDMVSKAALILLAGGGRGGRGQDGRTGVRGERGENGARTSKQGVDTGSGYGFPEEAIGKNGHPGGQAGSPGASANGGDGGQIELNVMDPVTADIVYDMEGGEGGTEARPGERGPGGPGGSGAVCKMFDQKTGRPVEDRKAPDGKEGPQGAPAAHGGSTGEDGRTDERFQFNHRVFEAGRTGSLSFAELAQTLSLSQLLFAQNAADMDFLNARSEAELAAVAASYAWLIEINQPFTGGASGIDAARVRPQEQKVRARIHDSAVVSLMRLQQGLDFYGHSYNWTPVLNLVYLAGRTSEMITLGTVIEQQYNKYIERGSTNAKQIEAFKEAKTEIEKKQKGFDDEIAKLQQQIDSFKTEIEEFSEDIARQRTVLVEGELKFKDDLIRHLREEAALSLEDFLDMLGTVISCVGGVATGVGGVKTAIDAAKKAEGLFKQAKGVVEVFKKVKGTIDAIKKAYESVADLIDAESPNAAKLLVDGKELDDLLKKYMDKVDSAGDLRKAMDCYVKLCQARNMAAYNYTTLVAQILTAQAQRDQLFSGIQHINAEMAAHQDNVLPVYTAYLRDAYEDAQRDLLRNIYLENRAYQYWSLKERPLETENLNVATLADAHLRLMKAIDGFRDNNEDFDPFTETLVVSAERYPNEFAAMPEAKSLTFTLDIRRETGFRNMSYIMARAFKLEFPDIQDRENTLFINLIHSGQALMNSDVKLDKPGALHVYSHRPRVRAYKIDYGESKNTAGGNLGDEKQGYIGLSPFTTWRIDFAMDGNEWLLKKLATIKTVKLTFEGRMLGPGRRLQVAPP